MKIKVLTLFTKIISLFLVILGYQSCDGNDPVDEYGAPSAKYKVKGTVISDTENDPVKGIRAVLLNTNNDKEVPYLADTVYTDNVGNFMFEKQQHVVSKFILKLQDIDGEENGEFEEKIVTVDFKDVEFEGGEGWYQGEAQKDLDKIAITSIKKETE